MTEVSHDEYSEILDDVELIVMVNEDIDPLEDATEESFLQNVGGFLEDTWTAVSNAAPHAVYGAVAGALVFTAPPVGLAFIGGVESARLAVNTAPKYIEKYLQADKAQVNETKKS